MSSNSDRISKQQRNAIKSARKSANSGKTVETVKYLGSVKRVGANR